MGRFKRIAMIVMTLSLSEALCLAADIKMRVVVVNPSQDKTQTTTIRKDLPREVSPKDIKDTGGLDVDFDNAQSTYYVFKNAVELAPGETKTYEVILDDVWLVKDERVKNLRDRTDNVMDHLKGTQYFQQADLIAKTIYGRLDEIVRGQTDPTITRQQHIANFRENLKVLESVQQDIDRLEKILVAVGGPPNLELMEKSKVDLKAPNQKTTWIVIFVILVFVFILAGAFFFTWHSQARTTENIFTTQKSDSFADFKKPKAPGTENGEKQ